ncbi:MAG: hypothetical protein ACYC3S_00675 [Chloroflexota bacterium]
MDLAEEVNLLTGGVGVDVVLEAAGAVKTIPQSLFRAWRGGIVVQVAGPANR